jgi:hypothetical protein
MWNSRSWLAKKLLRFRDLLLMNTEKEPDPGRKHCEAQTLAPNSEHKLPFQADKALHLVGAQ